MAHELEVEDILIPKPKPQRRRRPQPQRREKTPKGSGGFMKFIAGLFIVLAVLVVIISLSDIGGGAVLKIAQDFLGENYKLSLNAEKITGNPVKGYTLHNFELSEQNKNQKILSAGFLSGRLSFPALFTGKIRLAEISIGGLDLNAENLIETVEKLKNSFKPVSFNSEFFAPVKPAYADDKNTIPDRGANFAIPLDKFSIKDSSIAQPQTSLILLPKSTAMSTGFPWTETSALPPNLRTSKNPKSISVRVKSPRQAGLITTEI